jgi:putative heme-binding domain-containing protein
LHSVANRTTALAILLKESPADSALILERFMQSLEDGPVLADVVRRLGAYPKSATAPALVAARLKSPDARVRAAAIAALGELRAQPGRDAVVELLKDGDVRVRRAAAAAAGKLDVALAIEPLLQLIRDGDPEMRAACLDSLRRLREPRVVPHAVAALGDPLLEIPALECLADLGNPDHAKAIVEFAKRSPSVNGLALAVRALTAWQSRLDAKTRKHRELGHAIAEIHGASGLLVRWETGPPTPRDDAPQVVARFGRFGMPEDAIGWRTIFATGAESRAALDSKSDPKNPLRFAYADIAATGSMSVEFLGSSRGDFEVWLNGKSIHRRKTPGKYQIDSDRFSSTLDKGANRLLVAASAPDGATEFHLHFRRKSDKAEHEKLAQAALSRPGNAERGRKVFLDKERSQCLKCHQLANQGERIGPDLTGVGARFSRIHLIESILEPSRTIAPSFGTFVVTLKNGKTLNGVKVVESETMVTFADNQGQKHTFKKTEIDEVHPSSISTMPDGLEQRLTADEFVDLIGFLTSQNAPRMPAQP